MLRFIYSFYLLCCLANSQSDVVTYMTSTLVGHYVKPWPFCFALLLTSAFVVEGVVASKVLEKYGRSEHSAQIIVAWTATALLSIPFGTFIHQLLLALTAGILFFLFEKTAMNEFKRLEKDDTPSSLRTFYSRSVMLVALCLFTGIGCATSDLKHYELQTAQALQAHRNKRTYKIGDHSYVTSPRLFAMRCFALSQDYKKGLGNEIFNQMTPDSCTSACLLFPTDSEQNLLFPAKNLYRLLGSYPQPGETPLDYFNRCAEMEYQHVNKRKKHHVAIDYYLCALLLDRKLEQFAFELRRYRHLQIVCRSLPLYYAQALILYNELHPKQTVDYKDDTTIANYQDYMDLAKQTPTEPARGNKLRETYGETYWWWYYYRK